MIAGLLALAITSTSPAELDACFSALDAATVRVEQLEAQLRDAQRRLDVRTSTRGLSVTVYCPPASEAAAREALSWWVDRPWWVDVLTHGASVGLGLYLGERRSCGGP